MDVEIAALCDAATEDPHGKLNILGTFDTIGAREYPVVHPHCAIAYRLRFARVEEGRHQIRVSFIDEDGRPIMPPLEGHIEVKFPEGSDSAISNHIVNIQRLKFKGPGRYSIDLAIDGRQEKALMLRVVDISKTT